jgi:hypothetical protein
MVGPVLIITLFLDINPENVILLLEIDRWKSNLERK